MAIISFIGGALGWLTVIGLIGIEFGMLIEKLRERRDRKKRGRTR